MFCLLHFILRSSTAVRARTVSRRRHSHMTIVHVIIAFQRASLAGSDHDQLFFNQTLHCSIFEDRVGHGAPLRDMVVFNHQAKGSFTIIDIYYIHSVRFLMTPSPSPKAYSKMLIFSFINSNMHHLHHALIVSHVCEHNHKQNY